jgi:hypothetical protein
MAKSDITQEQARGLVDRIAQELGLLVAEKSGFVKVEGPTNKHRVYVQRSKTLGRIDTTLPLSVDDEMYEGLKGPLGSITCHIKPTLEYLERALRMLGDGAMSTQVINRPRPFAANKGPNRRTPKAIAPPVNFEKPVEPEEYIAEGGTLEARLKDIRARAREARLKRIMEERNVDREEALLILDRKVEEADVIAYQKSAEEAETNEFIRESGIEIEQ